MALFWQNMDTSGTLRRLLEGQRDLQQLGSSTATRLASSTPTSQVRQQGGDTRSDFLLADGATSTSVGVDGDAQRSQSTPGTNKTGLDDLGDSPTGGTGTTRPVDNLTDVGERGAGGTGSPRLPTERPEGGDEPGSGPVDVPVDGQIPTSTPPPDTGDVEVPIEEDPDEPETPTDGDGEGELPDGQISGLGQLAELLVNRLNQPDPFSEEEILQLREAMNAEFDAQLEDRFRQEDLGAARRGAFFSTLPVAGRQQAVADINVGRNSAEAALLDRIVNARETRSRSTIDQALNFLGMAQNEEQARQQLALTALQLSELGAIDPNSVLALLMGEGAGPAGPTGSEYDLLLQMLGGLLGGGEEAAA